MDPMSQEDWCQYFSNENNNARLGVFENCRTLKPKYRKQNPSTLGSNSGYTPFEFVFAYATQRNLPST